MKNTGDMSKGKILRVKQGYNPNSSSVGSVVFAFPAVMLAIPAVFGAVSAVIFSKVIKGGGTDGSESPASGGEDGQ